MWVPLALPVPLRCDECGVPLALPVLLRCDECGCHWLCQSYCVAIDVGCHWLCQCYPGEIFSIRSNLLCGFPLRALRLCALFPELRLPFWVVTREKTSNNPAQSRRGAEEDAKLKWRLDVTNVGCHWLCQCHCVAMNVGCHWLCQCYCVAMDVGCHWLCQCHCVAVSVCLPHSRQSPPRRH
jgi:hypothetical protein